MSENNSMTTEMTPEELEKLILEEQAKAEGGKNEKPEPIRIKVNNEEYTFTDSEQLSKTLENVVGGYQSKLQEAAKQLEELRAQNEEGNRGSYVSDDEGPRFDMKTYIETLEKDPIKAAEYVDNYRYFDGKAKESPSKLLKERLNRAEETERTLAAYQFKDMHPEYVGSPEYAKVLDSVRTKLGLPWTAQGLDAAYNTAVSNGLLPNFREMAAKKQQQEQDEANNRGRGDDFGSFKRSVPGVNPSNNGGFTVGGVDPESLTLDQLEAILKRAGKF